MFPKFVEENEANDTTTVLENRIRQSKMEVQRMESLLELEELHRRHRSTDFKQLLQKYDKVAEGEAEKEDELVRTLLGKRNCNPDEVKKSKGKRGKSSLGEFFDDPLVRSIFRLPVPC